MFVLVNPSAAIVRDFAFTGSLVTYTPRSLSASVVDSGVFPMWYWCAGYPFTGSLVTYTPRSLSASVVDSGVFPMWYWCAGYPFTGSLVTYTPRSFSASVVDSGVFPMWYWCAGYPFTGSLVTYTPRSFSASVVDSGVFPMWYWCAGYPFTGSLVTYTPRSFSASVVDSGVFPMWYWCAGYPLPRCRTLHFSPVNCSSHFLFHSCSLVRSSGRKSSQGVKLWLTVEYVIFSRPDFFIVSDMKVKIQTHQLTIFIFFTQTSFCRIYRHGSENSDTNLYVFTNMKMKIQTRRSLLDLVTHGSYQVRDATTLTDVLVIICERVCFCVAGKGEKTYLLEGTWIITDPYDIYNYGLNR
ncbi:uncharacterized protein LOC126984505 isoform X2 [Eriocheir sinensis]|uniref:uncharacterized protein LOC126984505 isoform X2 n=1 Tax=Eriocheir sinensis TaxID=95602 RepID=UPI0021C5BBDD|nr:uncharacterized protein LOC126984505 isoform X2 [Eriocheir sinensis]